MAIRRWLWIPVLVALAGACGGGTTRTLTARRIPQSVPTVFAGTLQTTTTAPATTTTTTPLTTAPPGVIIPNMRPAMTYKIRRGVGA
jgi:hypothetical protein